jgi:hypothetical protein
LVVAGTLAAVFLLQSFFASRQKSPVYDEPPHIASGLSYIETGVFHANPQHPPLLKEMSAVFLSLAGIHWPKSADAGSVIRGGPAGADKEWTVGNDIIADNGPDRVMFWARLPFILLAGLLGAAIYAWGREIVGPGAALGALFLYALDPTVLAHSYLVTTDAGLAAFTVLLFWSVWRYTRHPSRRRMVMCGLALGAALGAKFSGLFWLPVAAVLLAASLRWPDRQTASDPLPAPRSAKAGPNSPCPCGSGKKYKKCHGAGGSKPERQVERSLARRTILECAGAFLAMCLIAAVVVEALYFFPRDPFLYLAGLKKVNADHVAGYQYYFHGDTSTRFYNYFAAAYLLKEPLATILLAVGGLWGLLRSRSTPILTKLFLLFPPAVFLAAMTIFADDMGVRYLIPALPFAYLLGGLGLAALCRKRFVWGRYAAAALCVWVAIEAAGIYPDHLSYFNEMACLLEKPGQIGWDGGSRCGPLWLDDSNVDWGQGLKQLRWWMDRHGNGRTLHLAYPGTFPPEAYGLRFEPVRTSELVPDPAPGLYAVSAHQVGRMPTVGAKFLQGGAQWLRRTTPVDIVGHAFYIYDVK